VGFAANQGCPKLIKSGTKNNKISSANNKEMGLESVYYYKTISKNILI